MMGLIIADMNTYSTIRNDCYSLRIHLDFKVVTYCWYFATAFGQDRLHSRTLLEFRQGESS